MIEGRDGGGGKTKRDAVDEGVVKKTPRGSFFTVYAAASKVAQGQHITQRRGQRPQGSAAATFTPEADGA